MADETHRSVVRFDAEAQAGIDALNQILERLDRIEVASRRTADAWQSVIQTMGETAYIRVHGMEQLIKNVQRVGAEVRGLQGTLGGATAGMAELGVGSGNAASMIVAFEMQLVRLRQQLQGVERTLTRLGGISLAPLWESMTTIPPGVQEQLRQFELTTAAMGQLPPALLQTMSQIPQMKAGAAVGPDVQSLLDYWQAVSAGQEPITTLTDAFSYLTAQIIVLNQVGALATQGQRDSVRAITDNAKAMMAQETITHEIVTTEELLATTRKAHADVLDQESNAAARLTDAVEALQGALSQEAEARQAAAGAPPVVTEESISREERASEVSVALNLALLEQIAALQGILQTAGGADAALAGLAGTQEALASATRDAVQAAEAQAAVPPTMMAGAGGRGGITFRYGQPAEPAPEEPYIVPEGLLADYQQLEAHLRWLNTTWDLTSEKINQAGQRTQSYRVSVQGLDQTLGTVAVTYNTAGQAMEEHYRRQVQTAQGINVTVDAVYKLRSGLEGLADLMQQPAGAVGGGWAQFLQSAPMEQIHARLQSLTEAFGPLNVVVQQNGERTRTQALRWIETGQAAGQLTETMDAQSQAQQRLYDYTLATGEAESMRVRILTDLTGATERVTLSEKKREGILAGMGRRLQVHFRWMLRYIILWKGMQLVQDVVKGWFQANMQLHGSMALLRTSIGDNVLLVRQYRDAMYSAAAAARALPTEMAPAALAVGRIYAPEDAEKMMKAAGELALVSGEKVADVTGVLIVLQRQLGLSSEQMTGVLDSLAGSLRHTHLTYADLVPMLRRAGTYTERYNMGIAETVGLQAGVAAATGATSSELDSMMRRLAQIYELGGDAQLALDAMGIATVVVGENAELIHRPLVDVLRDIVRHVGDNEHALESLSDKMFRTGSIGRILFESMVRHPEIWERSIIDATTATGAWNETVEEVAKTWGAAMQDIKGGWEDLLTSLKMDQAFIEDIHMFAEGLRAVGEAIRYALDAWEDWQEIAPTSAEMIQGWQTAGVPPFGGPGGWVASRITAAILKRMGVIPEPGAAGPPGRGVVGEQVLYPQLPPGAPGAQPAPQLPRALSVRTTTVEIPEGVNFDDVIDSYEDIANRWIGTFVDQQGNYYRITQRQIDEASQQVLVLDEATGEFRLFRAFLPALQEAIKENTEALKKAQPALRFVEFDPRKWAGPVQSLIRQSERMAKTLGFEQEARPQVLWGPDDSILRLIATDIGLQIAMHRLTEAVEENTDAMTEGMWNIPEGVTAWVPITSLFYQGLQRPGGGDPWATANISNIVEQLIARGAAIGGDAAAGGGAGAGGVGFAGGIGPSWAGWAIPGVTPLSTEMSAAAGDLTGAASNLTGAAYDLEGAAQQQARMDVVIDYMRATVDFATINVQTQYSPINPFGLPGGAEGAIVRYPTAAIIGERGPEIVAPLSQMPGASPLPMMDGQEATFRITLMMDGRVLAQATRKAVMEVL